MSHFLGRKNWFFWIHFLRDHYALVFTRLLHTINLLFIRFEFAQDSKNFQKMAMIDVQNRDRRNLFAQKRALLGVLRNFLGTQYSA
uniref:Uncharacterized protein n=1 Tax=viral metagenome TaxID=1070528 RepID=A0A6C0I589_9ZZZZ